MRAPFPAGFHPFWFWNDRITPERIRSHLDQMSLQGIRGVFIHSRQGLGQPYMSSRFLEMVGLAIDEATSRGMAVHLYDEYPYPSGAAGGAVVQSDPALASTKLEVTRQRFTGGALRRRLPPGHLLNCVAVPFNSAGPDWQAAVDLRSDVGMVLTRDSYFNAAPQPYNDRRYFADQPAPVVEALLAEGDWELWAVSECVVSAHKYWHNFPDMTNTLAVQKFVELTHERYSAALGDRLALVTSIFVDEVEPGVSRSVLVELERRHGDDSQTLTLAYVAPSHPRHLEALRIVDDLRLEMFTTAFEHQIAGWCHAHGVRYSGEKPSLRLRQLAEMDVPGCEPGHTKAGAKRSDLLQADIRGNARATASAAYFYEKEGSLCECFHSLGWGATLQDAKVITESLIAFGTRWLVPHAFFYSTRGLRKHDAPPSFLQMPYWPLFGRLSQRVDIISKELEGSVIDASVGLVEPSGGLPDDEQRLCYEELQHRLVDAHCEFLTVDTDILASGSFTSRGWSYRDVVLEALVVPPMRAPQENLLRLLEAFEAQGGLVARIAPGDDLEDVATALARRVRPAVAVSVLGGHSGAGGVICARRRAGARHWLFVVNTAPRLMQLSLSGSDALEPLDLGCPPPQIGSTSLGETQLHLAPFESVLLRTTTDRAQSVPVPQPRLLDLATAGPWRLRPLSPNVLRLGRWRMTVMGPRGLAWGSAIVEPLPIANQLARSSVPIVAHISERFGLGPEIGLPDMTVRYETWFECDGTADLTIAMQDGALAGTWAMYFDESGPLGPAQLRDLPELVEDCVGIPVECKGRTGCFGRHIHEVSVEITVSAPDQGLRDSIFIIGAFSVFSPSRNGAEVQRHLASGEPEDVGDAAAHPLADKPVVALLSSPRAQASLADWEDSGLPYYAGVVEYSRYLDAVELEALRPGDIGQKRRRDVVVELRMPDSCEEAAEVAFGDGPYRAVPWSPRRVSVPEAELLGGPVLVRVRLSTALARLFEGRWFDPLSHSYKTVALAQAPETL